MLEAVSELASDNRLLVERELKPLDGVDWVLMRGTLIALTTGWYGDVSPGSVLGITRGGWLPTQIPVDASVKPYSANQQSINKLIKNTILRVGSRKLQCES